MDKKSIKYALTQGVFTLIGTLVICLVLFVIMTKGHSTLDAVAMDLPIGIACTALICLVLQVFMIKGSVKKGKVPEMSIDGQAAYALVPKNTAAFVLFFTVLAFIIFGGGTIGILYIFVPNIAIAPIPYAILKAVISGFAGGYVTYHANVFISALYQRK